MAIDDLQMEHVCPVDDVKLRFLYQNMEERVDEPGNNISHRKMPTWAEHVAFVAKQPYYAWYIITVNEKWCGTLYITRAAEIGIYVRPEHRKRGIAKRAIEWAMRSHPHGRYLANINPTNKHALALFKALGFRDLQITMIRER